MARIAILASSAQLSRRFFRSGMADRSILFIARNMPPSASRNTRPPHNTVSIMSPMLEMQQCCCFLPVSQRLLVVDQASFSGYVERLDLAFASCCRTAVWRWLLKHQVKRAAPPCVFGTGACPMCGKPGRQISGDACIQAVVPTFEDVDHPTHLMALPFMPRCRIA